MARSGAVSYLTSIVALCACLALTLAPAAEVRGETPGTEDQPVAAEDWQTLLREERPDQAEPLCRELLAQGDKARQVEGHKCLANVILFRSKIAAPIQDGAPGVMTAPHQGWDPAGADAAVAELDAAMALAPGDLSLHQMRLFVLYRSGRPERLAAALEDSLQRYKGPDVLDHWLSFSRELWGADEFAPGLAYLQVLAAKYPNNPQLLGNLAAFAAQLDQFDQALDYATQAATLQPENPRLHWNLAGVHQRKGDLAAADAAFQKALGLFNARDADAAWCAYADFVAKELKDEQRGAALRAKHCKTPPAQ